MERRNQVWSSNKALIDKREVKLSFNAVPNRPLDTWVGGGGKLPEKVEKALSYKSKDCFISPKNTLGLKQPCFRDLLLSNTLATDMPTLSFSISKAWYVDKVTPTDLSVDKSPKWS